MEEKKQSAAPKKLSYEELQNTCHQLSEQARTMHMQLQEINMQNVFKRLDLLFKVLEFKDSFDTQFIMDCVKEIEEIMVIPKETEDK